MISIKDIVDAVNSISPESLQESWDNSGLQVCLGLDRPVEKIMTCLEINDDVIIEAQEKGVDIIITHHPLIFGKIASVKADDVTGKQIIELISSDISVYSAHTSFDSARHGTNQYLADKLGLGKTVPIIAASEYEGCGMGRFGIYGHAEKFSDFLNKIDSICGRSDIRVAGRVPEYVSRVALCTGAGSEFIDDAYKMGADVFITGDLKYHDARHADDIGLCVVDAGHFGTEVIFADNMAAQLQDIFGSELEIIVSETDINPFVKF